MSLDPDPIFRKVIVPWYETKGVCWTLIVSMALVLFFGMAGVSVAALTPGYRGFMWVPILLIVLSLMVIVSSVRQLLTFYID
jgi:hypothetical protein